MYAVCERNGWGDPFSYAFTRNNDGYCGEAKIADTYGSADGFDDDGGAEYKSTIQKNIQGAYNGISVQATWKIKLPTSRREDWQIQTSLLCSL